MKRPLKLARGKPRRAKEKEVEYAIDERLGHCGFRPIRFSQARSTQQTLGIPDRRYVHQELGLAVWWEVKAPDGKWSEEQQRFAEDCDYTRELYFIGGLDEMYAMLRVLGCWDGTVFRPGGWHPLKMSGAPGRLSEWILTVELRRLATDTQTYWRLTPAERRRTLWTQWQREHHPAT